MLSHEVYILRRKVPMNWSNDDRVSSLMNELQANRLETTDQISATGLGEILFYCLNLLVNWSHVEIDCIASP